LPSFRNIFRYMRHYGIKSTLGLIREKLVVDPKRFSTEKERSLPHFPASFNKSGFSPEDIEKKQKNVMYCLHYFYPKKKGGTERFTLNLAKENERRGGKSVVLVLDANEPESLYTERLGDILYRYYEYEGILCIGFRHRRAPLGLYYKNITESDGAMRDFCRHILTLHSIDVVHATYPQPFAPFLLECAKISVPYVVTCTDFCMACHYATMVDDKGDFCKSAEGGRKCAVVCKTYGCKDFKERLRVAERVLRGAFLVTVPSEFVAKILSSEFPSVEFLPIGHGISDTFKSERKRECVRRFVYAGTITQLKGIHLLIEAFSRLQGEDLSLLIYGSGDSKYESRLRAMADRRVRFMGAAPIAEMPRIYSEADCVIIPSMWYETYNFVLREAASCGALVIAADIGAMSEAIKIGKNGYLFKPASGEDLYEKMRLATEFDFKNYEYASYPTVEDEGEIYSAIYSAAIRK